MKCCLAVLVLLFFVMHASEGSKRKRPKPPGKDDQVSIFNMMTNWKKDKMKHKKITKAEKQKLHKLAKDIKDKVKEKRAKKNKKSKSNGKSKRTKRQTEETICERKEFRSLTFEERQQFADRIRNLTTLYHLIAGFHNDDLAPPAHGGSGFLCWHRFFLVLFEHVLGVCLPYWASCLEYRLGHYMNWDFRQSALFGDHALGSVTGAVTNGLFANQQVYSACTGSGAIVTRSGGTNAYNLYQDSDLKVEYPSYTEHKDFCIPFNSRFEYDHGSCHSMIGGHMNDLNCAPNDIIFYMHHSFVDYIWESSRAGRANAETSYPSDDAVNGTYEAHRKGEPLEPFSTADSPVSVGEILENEFRSSFYNYHENPCEIACQIHSDCGSDMLWCDSAYNECIPKIVKGNRALTDGNGNVVAESIYCPPGQIAYLRRNIGRCRTV